MGASADEGLTARLAEAGLLSAFADALTRRDRRRLAAILAMINAPVETVNALCRSFPAVPKRKEQTLFQDVTDHPAPSPGAPNWVARQ